MTSAVIVGDIHLSDRPPSGRTNDYATQILGKLSYAALFAASKNVPLVLAGDVFHFKAPTKNSHKLVQDTHVALAGVRTFIVPGNHDMQHDRLDSLSRQPLGALARMENVSLLIGEDSELPGIAGVPYITEFDGGSWERALDEQWNQFEIESPSLLVTHAPIFPPGQEPGVYASISAKEWAEYWIGVPATYYGHIHDHHGTFSDPEGYMQFCNQGALSRGSLHEASVTRQPAVTLWDGSSFTRIEVPHRPPEDVFLFDQAEQKKLSKASAAEYVQLIGSVQLNHLTLESLHASLRKDAPNDRVRKIAEQALEDVQ